MIAPLSSFSSNEYVIEDGILTERVESVEVPHVESVSCVVVELKL